MILILGIVFFFKDNVRFIDYLYIYIYIWLKIYKYGIGFKGRKVWLIKKDVEMNFC